MESPISPLIMAEAAASRARVRARIKDVAARIARADSSAAKDDHSEAAMEIEPAADDQAFAVFSMKPRRS
jgi:hypothetical protein